MNPQWETLWKQDLERRAAEAREPIERYRHKIAAYRLEIDRYAAKVDEYRKQAEDLGFGKDHPGAAALMKYAESIKLDLPEPPSIEFPDIEFPNITAPVIPKP